MTALYETVAATLHFDVALAPSIWSLAAPVAFALRKMDAVISHQDAGVDGDSIRFVTDLGDVALLAEPPRGDTHGITVSVTPHPLRDAETAPGLCHQITRAVSRQQDPRCVFWHPGAEEAERPAAGPLSLAARARGMQGRFAVPIALH